jgi:AcrR family transcriptional regulator
MTPGRKRSEQSRLAILAAAFELAVEVGYANTTLEGIAARSGAGKQTIYRWWPSKADVVLDALATKTDVVVPLPDTGNFRQDLLRFLVSSFTAATRPEFATLLRALMAQAQLDPDFGRRFRTGFLHRRRDTLRVLLDRAAERDELPRGMSADTVADVVFGVIWYRLLATDRPLDEELANELTTVLGRTRS